jgi:hypothetical protein
MKECTSEDDALFPQGRAVRRQSTARATLTLKLA